MSFGYVQLYANGLNDNSQIRRSADMVYQRGGTYKVVLTGTTYEPSMQLVVDMYANGSKVGTMALVPYSITSGATSTYTFGIRPYNYMQNFLQTQHYENYWANDWQTTNQLINQQNPYPNSIQASFKYCWRYVVGTTYVYEGGVPTPSNAYNHFTYIPESINPDAYVPSQYISTGDKFDYIGGAFQLDDSFITQNFDQEIGTTIGSGFAANTMSLHSGQSPICQYLMDYPTVPEQSETSRFLTSAPRIQYIQSDENYVLYFLNGQTGDRQVIEADYAVFEFYNVDNTKVGTYNLDLSVTGQTSPTGYTDTLKIFALPCGPVDIHNIYTGMTFDNVAYYRVQLYYSYPIGDSKRQSVGPIGPISETFYFYLYENCLPESTRICWLNDQGTYDYFTFRSYRQDSKKITTTSYDNRYYATNLSSPDRNVARTNKTFDTSVSQEIVLESSYLTVGQGRWLESLFTSPQVYLLRSDFISPIDRPNYYYKDLRPLQLLSTQVDTITKKHKKLNKYSITFKTGDSYFVNKGF
jgi:hypothetical protein